MRAATQSEPSQATKRTEWPRSAASPCVTTNWPTFSTHPNVAQAPSQVWNSTVGCGSSGDFPAWLAPVQAVVANITDAQADWVREVEKALSNQGFRVKADLRNEKIGYKIREHTLQKVPYLLVVGDREKENGAVAVRTRSGEDLGTMSLADFMARLHDENGPAA